MCYYVNLKYNNKNNNIKKKYLNIYKIYDYFIYLKNKYKNSKNI
jgi:hypothetical protein